MAFISQQAWIFTASIKQNILFGHAWNKARFERVVEACSLAKDLALLPFGENTLAAERGINLSGGQRARISMARALYSDADIFLFDDSLSAVDGPVAKFLLTNCINGYLKSKIRVLVTHHAQHLEYADKVGIIKLHINPKNINWHRECINKFISDTRPSCVVVKTEKD